MKDYYVYILASKLNGTLYIGVTSDIIKRVWEHKNNVTKGFASKYKVDKLVYFEKYGQAVQAIQREKRLKEWPRKWKLDLINQNNVQWVDLYQGII